MSQPPVGEDIPRVYEAIEHLRCLFDEVTLIILQLIIWLQVKDGVKSLPIVRHLLIQACQVKLVLNVVFINLENEIMKIGREIRQLMFTT